MMAPAEQNSYIELYRPLTDQTTANDNTASISVQHWAARFVTLFPGQFKDPIRCQLHPSSIGRMHSKYEALSYTWGDVTNKVQICVNGNSILVTQSLESALRHLRLANHDRVLWIDSVCIDQSNVTEVNTQVRRMWSIYEYAQRVLVFLGPQKDDSDQALSFLSELATLPVGLERQRITALLEDPQKMDLWEALLRLMQRSWRSRAWIIQEYAVARTVTFVCGSLELLDEDFGKALEVLVDYRFNGEVPLRHQRLIRHVASTPIHHLWVTRRGYQTSGPDTRLSATNILYRFRGSKAFDPRDKIFSLYRLIAENRRLASYYGRSAVELFIDVVKVMIETSGTLEVLSHHNRPIQGIAGMPTWCPDWTVLRGKRILLWPNQYQAAGHHDDQTLFRIEKETLILRGKFLDHIKWAKTFESRDFQDLANIYREIVGIELIARQLTDPKNENIEFEDALRRTFVAARLRTQGPNQDATILNQGAADPFWDAWSCQMQGKPCNTEWARWYNDALYSAMCGRAFIVTESGILGLADGTAQIGDMIGVFAGGQVPLALRHVPASPEEATTSRRYELVGEW